MTAVRAATIEDRRGQGSAGAMRIKTVNLEASESIESAYGWWLATLALLMASVGFVAASSVPILLKPLTSDLGVGTGAVSRVHMLMLIGAGVGGLVLGHLHDRIGFFKLAMVGAGAISAGLIAASQTRDLTVFAAHFFLLIGVFGQGIFFSPLTAALSLWFDRHRPLAIALVASGQGVGGLLLAPALRIAAENHGWRSAMLVLGLASGVILVACGLGFRRTPPIPRVPASEGRVSTYHKTEPHRRHTLMPILSLSLGLSCFATFIAIGHLTAAAEERGISPAGSALLFSVMLGASLATRLGSTFVGARAGHYVIMVLALAAHLLGCALLAASATLLPTVMGALLVGLGFGVYLPGYAILVRELYPEREAGRRIGEINFLGFVASGAGSWTGGLLHDLTGNYHMAFSIATASTVLGLVMLLWPWSMLRKY